MPEYFSQATISGRDTFLANQFKVGGRRGGKQQHIRLKLPEQKKKSDNLFQLRFSLTLAEPAKNMLLF